MKPSDFKPYPMPLGRLDLPAPGQVDLWWLDLALLGNPLHPDDTTTGATLTPRQLRTLRRFYLRLLLGAYLGVPGKDVHISRLIKGKPVISGPAGAGSLDFSSAGSADRCLIGVAAEGPLGVDLERADRRAGSALRVAKRYFSEVEAAALAACPDEDLDAEFMRLWAGKEAVVKGAGHGIANQLSRFTLSMGRSPRMVAMEDDDPAAWRLALVWPSERHVGAVALRADQLRLNGRKLLPPEPVG